MVADFPRIITLLRKEKNLSQKTAAAELGISQALLSHYEKGIRECGLDFVVKAAKYYGVSCDYLLGLSPNRDGLTISVDDIPDAEKTSKDNILRGSLIPVLNKKLIFNSLNIVFAMLQNCENKAVVSNVSESLMLASYKAFRDIYSLSPKNNKDFFTLPLNAAGSAAIARIIKNEARLLGGTGDYQLVDPDCFSVNTEELAKQFPLYYPSLSNLIKECEKGLAEE